MALLDSGIAGFNPSILRRRPTDAGNMRNHSRGGISKAQPMDPPFRQDFNQMNRYSPNVNDTKIVKAREYVFRRPAYFRPGDTPGNHSWTNDGPARDIPTFRYNRNWRPIVGGSHQSEWGRHTNPATGMSIGNQLAGRSRMRPAGQNRLTVQRYRGQSFSQTTQLAGQ